MAARISRYPRSRAAQLIALAQSCDDDLKARLSRLAAVRTGRPAERKMTRRPAGFTVLMIIVCLLAAGCLGEEHPDLSRYEYRYMNGAFVTPYTDFPEGRERGEWLCFDGKTQTTFDCTFVRGGWDHYKYIFRKRRPNPTDAR